MKVQCVTHADKHQFLELDGNVVNALTMTYAQCVTMVTNITYATGFTESPILDAKGQKYFLNFVLFNIT